MGELAPQSSGNRTQAVPQDRGRHAIGRQKTLARFLSSEQLEEVIVLTGRPYFALPDELQPTECRRVNKHSRPAGRQVFGRSPQTEAREETPELEMLSRVNAAQVEMIEVYPGRQPKAPVCITGAGVQSLQCG